jgi:hypothetical protein
MRSIQLQFVFRTLITVLAASAARAQWPSTPNDTLVLSTLQFQVGTQPHIATRSDGGAYVAWCLGGNAPLYLQSLNAGGVELWNHGGIVIDSYPLVVSAPEFDLSVAADGDALIAVPDQRDGHDLDVQVLRYDTSGHSVWGTDGITVSANPVLDLRPSVIEASDGDVVVLWNPLGPYPSQQRFSASGAPRFAPGGIALDTAPLASATAPELIRAENGNVIFSGFDFDASNNTRVGVCKLTPAGTTAWSTVIYDGGGINGPSPYRPIPVLDGNGGAAVTWHVSINNVWRSFVQRVDAFGTEVFPHNGVSVATTANTNQLQPALVFDAASGDSYVFWANWPAGSTTQYSMYGQKITALGARAFADSGLSLSAVGSSLKYPFCAAASSGGAAVFFIDEQQGILVGDLRGTKVDSAGNLPWGSAPVLVAHGDSFYWNYVDCASADDGGVRLAWSSLGAGHAFMYAQNVNPDGSLGFPGPTSFCTAGTSSAGCVGQVSAQGTPSASAATPFDLVVTGLEGQRDGIIFFGTSGQIAKAWPSNAGTMCVRMPLQRTPVQTSSGTSGQCDGALDLDWNSYVAAHPGALGTPFTLGATVFTQVWMRDPPSSYGSVLTSGLRFVMRP